MLRGKKVRMALSLLTGSLLDSRTAQLTWTTGGKSTSRERNVKTSTISRGGSSISNLTIDHQYQFENKAF